MKRYLVLLLLLFAIQSNAFSQDSTEIDIQDQLEEVFEELEVDEEGLSGEQLVQFLEDLASNPINLNAASVTELIQIPGLSIILAQSIIEYRSTKNFNSIEELKLIKGIGEITFQKIRPYVTIGTDSNKKSVFSDPSYWLEDSKIEVISRTQRNLEEQEGYLRADSSGGYLGSPIKYYQRFNLQSNHFSANLTQEKDAGESLNGIDDFDFNSFHLGFRNNGNLKMFVLGDYNLIFGQGLVLWTGGAFGKGREVIGSVRKNERGVRPYASAQETNYFRGVAATYGDEIEFTFFYSNRPRSASIVGIDSVRFPTSSGFHRTESENLRRNNLSQETFGARFRLDSKFGFIGLTAYQANFDSRIVQGNSINDLYDFEGTSNSVVGLDYRGLIGKSLLFGEIGMSKNSAFAGLIGVESKLGVNTDISLSYRNYDKDYHSFIADGFGESSGFPQNESGWYSGLRHQFSKRLSASIYFDQYVFDAPRNGVLSSSKGFDWLAMLEFKASSNINGYLLFRNEKKDDLQVVQTSAGRDQNELINQERTSFRLHFENRPTRNIRLRSRLEIVQFTSGDLINDRGFLLYQDLRIVTSKKINIDARYTLFDTDSFNSRIYQFENDLLYVLSNVALSGKGQRWYLVVKYDLTDEFQISGKYSASIFEDRQTISSGLNEIQGNTVRFIGLQLRYSMKFK